VRGEGAEREDGKKRSPKGIVCKYFTSGRILVVEPARLEAAPALVSHHPHPRRKRRKRNQGAWV